MGNLVSAPIPNLIAGISQQPENVRLPTQGKEQVNCYSSVTDFLKRRPSTNFVKEIMKGETAASIGSSIYVHAINRDSHEKYIVVLTKNNVRVFDLEGNEKTVKIDPAGLAYLGKAKDMLADFRSQTINDYTFFVNRQVVVEEDKENKTPKRPNEALIFIKQASYNTTYTLTLNGKEYPFTTEDGIAPADKPADKLSSEEIAQKLVEQIDKQFWEGTITGNFVGTIEGERAEYPSNFPVANWRFFSEEASLVNVTATASTQDMKGPEFVGTLTNIIFKDGKYTNNYDDPFASQFPRYRNLKFTGVFTGTATPPFTSPSHGFSVYIKDSTIWVSRKDGADFEVGIKDSRSNTQTSMCKNRVQRFSDLLTVAPRGFVTEIVGDNQSGFDNYYVKFVPSNDTATFDKGLWVETVKPDIPYRIKASTMPMALIRQADGTFTFGPLEWGERVCGDEDSASMPSFVGKKINSLFFYRNRLSFLSDDNVIMSEAGKFFNFFVTTVTTLIDSDPIDVAASNTKTCTLQHAAVFSGGIIIFSDKSQFTLEHDSVLSNATVSVKPVTDFEADILAPPVGSGKTIFFSTSRGDYGGIREYLTMPDNSEQNDAADVTAHVPRYIANNIFKMLCSTNEDILFVLSRNDRKTMWVYKYFWNGSEKIQSSWSKWTFKGDILSVAMFENKLYAIMAYRDDGIYMESLDFSPAYNDLGENLEYCIDRKATEAECGMGVFDALTKTTTITLPFTFTEKMGKLLVVTRTAPHQRAGIVFDILRVNGKSVVISGDITTKKFFVGIAFQSRYDFSQFSIREQNKGNAITTGRLQLRNLYINCDKTGYLEANVTPRFRDTSTYVFTGREIGEGTDILGDIPLYSGRIKIPVLSLNTQVDISITTDSYLPCALINASWEGFYNARHRQL